jgi:hypothetical protein
VQCSIITGFFVLLCAVQFLEVGGAQSLPFFPQVISSHRQPLSYIVDFNECRVPPRAMTGPFPQTLKPGGISVQSCGLQDVKGGGQDGAVGIGGRHHLQLIQGIYKKNIP